MISSNNPLLRALTFNAIFSGFSALLMFIAGTWLAAQFGLQDPALIYTLGGFLALFALQLGNIVRTREIRNWEITSIIAADIAWVLGSVAIISLYYQSITAAGLMLMDIVAVAVLWFAVMQIRGLREYRKSAVPG